MGIQFDGINNEIKSQTKIDFPGSVGVAGTLTYEDVTNIDSVGIVTARTGIKIGPTAGVAGTFFADGSYVTAGIVTATTFHGSAANLTNIPAGQLTGTVADARISTLTASKLSGALPAISGANLTNLDASDLASGTVPTARLGSGTANSSTFLAGDSTYKTVSGTTINNNANNRIVTGSGTANTLEAETTLEWDGTNTLTVVNQGSGYPDFRFNTKTVAGGGEYELFRASGGRFRIGSTSTTANSSADELLIGNGSNDRGLTIFGGTSNIYFGDSSDNDIGKLEYVHSDNSMRFTTNTAERLRITSTGQLKVGNNPTISSGDFVNIEAPTSFNSGETIVTITGNSSTTGPRLNLKNLNTGANACSEILGADAGGQSTGYIRFNHTDQTNNYGEISFGTRNAQGSPPAERVRIKKDGKVTINEGLGVGGQDPGGSTLRVHGSIYASLGGNTSWQKVQLEGSNNTAGDAFSINNWGDAEGDYWMIGVNQTMNQSGNYSKTNSGKRTSFVTIDGRMGRVYLGGSSTSGNPTEHFYTDWSGSIFANADYGSLRAMYPCRAWANLSGDSSPATIRVSRGLSGVTDNGTGDYTFTFSSSFSDANYSALCSSAGDGGWSMVPHIYSHSDMNSNNVRFSINAVNVSGQNYDRDIFCMAIFR